MTFEDQISRSYQKKALDLCTTFFGIFVNTGQICKGFKDDTSEKLQKHANRKGLSDKDLVK